jgi:hypothetical protein
MTDSEIIWKFLTRELNDSHPALYLYCLGDNSQKTKAINTQIDLCIKVFSLLIKRTMISTVVKAFLEYKLGEYKKGNVKITSRYPTI